MEENKFGTFMLDGQMVNIDNMSVNDLEEMNKKFEMEEIKSRTEINKLLEEILKYEGKLNG